MTEPDSPENAEYRALQVRMVINRCRGQLAAGEDLDESAIAAEHPELMPELGSAVHKLIMIERAKRRAQQPDEIDETVGMGGATRSAKPQRIRYFGDYELIEEIARGGMGVVYRARQVSLNRIVAVKMILSGELATDEDVKRFHTEAEAAANLDHPNIVPIYEVGDHDGQHYFSMAYVEGRGLDEMIRDNPLPGKVAAGYMKQVAEAIHSAHEQGVVHRDLKPSNILIDEKDQPRITDFGLAKRVGTDSDLTATGQILGTPSYMPPEQALGDQSQIGPQSDVYALGAVLYCLITGRPPFVADSTAATLMQVIEEEPVAPRRLNPSTDRDLETIALKCLEKHGNRRYTTCGELSAEFDRYLEGKPIHARPISRPAKAWRWCRRNPVVAGLCAAFVLLLIATSIITSTLAISERAARERERQAQQRIITEQQANDRKRAASLVEAVLTAPAQAVPYAIENLEPLHEYAVPILERRLDDEDIEPTQRLHAAMALAHFGRVDTGLLVDGIATAPTGECGNLVMALNHVNESATEQLRQRAAIAEAKADWPLKSRFAIVALCLGDNGLAADMCSLRPGPIERTIFIEAFPKWHGTLGRLAKTVRSVDEFPLRSGICLGVGSIPAAEVSAEDKGAWQELLTDWHQQSPDTGTHSAAGWALRQWELPLVSIGPDTPPAEDRDWYVNCVGMTMLRISAGSVDYKDEKGRPQRVRVHHPFLISDREVSDGLFQQFIDDADYPKSDKPQVWTSVYSTTFRMFDHPVQKVSWYNAVLFCNWLSRKENLTPCYTGSQRSRDLVPDAGGYRLPTSAEWEYACRAGTMTEYAFGDDETLLVRYCVYAALRAEACGTKFPNGWGLFDMHGNVCEWCEDGDGSSRAYRGGSWYNDPRFCRSVNRDWLTPDYRLYYLGFRVARSTVDATGR